MGLQAALVGTSCRLDVLELLEKRVASRMSCRKELILEPGHGPEDADSATPSSLLQVLCAEAGQAAEQCCCAALGGMAQLVQLLDLSAS